MEATSASTTTPRSVCLCGEPLPQIEALGSTFTIAPRCAGCQTTYLREEAQAEQARRIAMLIARSGITAHTSEWSLATYPSDARGLEARQVALDWLDALSDPAHLPPNLILHGPVGTGKTGLAWGIVRECCHREIDARIVNVRDLMNAMRDAFREYRFFDTDNLERVNVLALDDLGAERVTAFSRDTLATLIERRYQAHRPTIVTANYPMSEIAARLGHDDPEVGARIVSRLTENAVQYRIDGPDRRRS